MALEQDPEHLAIPRVQHGGLRRAPLTPIHGVENTALYSQPQPQAQPWVSQGHSAPQAH